MSNSRRQGTRLQLTGLWARGGGVAGWLQVVKRLIADSGACNVHDQRFMLPRSKLEMLKAPHTPPRPARHPALPCAAPARHPARGVPVEPPRRLPW